MGCAQSFIPLGATSVHRQEAAARALPPRREGQRSRHPGGGGFLPWAAACPRRPRVCASWSLSENTCVSQCPLGPPTSSSRPPAVTSQRKLRHREAHRGLGSLSSGSRPPSFPAVLVVRLSCAAGPRPHPTHRRRLAQGHHREARPHRGGAQPARGAAGSHTPTRTTPFSDPSKTPH